MKTFALVAAIAGLATAVPASGAVTSAIAPAGEKTPDGCQTTYSGKFQVVVQSLSKRSLEERDSSTPLELTLKDGVLLDSQGRTGYIASNNQFQFDGPAQAGAIYTAGWSVCANSSIALGNSAIFYQCLSGTFYNLYDENTAAQCTPVYLNALSSGPAASGTVQNAVATGAHTVVCQIGDGQIQQDTCITTATAAPTTSSKPTGATITQIGDGQIQAPVSATATATSTVAKTTAATTGAVITQIGDGQVQAGNSSTIAVTSRASTSAASTTAATTAAATTSRTVAASNTAVKTFGSEVFGLVAAVAAIAFLL